MSVKPTACQQDAAFVNELVSDFRGTPKLTDELSQKIHETAGIYGDILNPDLVTNEMLRDAWQKVPNRKGDENTFRRFRAEVFLSLLSKVTYHLDETKLKGDASQALRSLVSANPSVTSHGVLFKKAIGGDVAEIQVAPESDRIYLLTADKDRSFSSSMPDEGMAVIANRHESWYLGLPNDVEIPLAVLDDTRRLSPQEEKKESTARGSVRDLLIQYLGLPSVNDTIVRVQSNSTDSENEQRAFAQKLLAAMDAVDGVQTELKPTKLDNSPVERSELTEKALGIIHAFCNGEGQFLKGYVSDDKRRCHAEDIKETGEIVEKLVGFVAQDQSARWGTERLANAESDESRADMLVNGFKRRFDPQIVEDLSLKHVRRETVKRDDAPKFVKAWLKDNEHLGSVLISMVGPNRHIDELRGTNVERIFVDGNVAGYAVHYQFGGHFAAVFDAKGKLLDPKATVDNVES